MVSFSISFLPPIVQAHRSINSVGLQKSAYFCTCGICGFSTKRWSFCSPVFRLIPASRSAAGLLSGALPFMSAFATAIFEVVLVLRSAYPLGFSLISGTESLDLAIIAICREQQMVTVFTFVYYQLPSAPPSSTFSPHHSAPHISQRYL